MSDTFRKVYKKLHDDNSRLIVKIKEACEALEALMNVVNSREMSLAKTNLEQASMWATKAVVLADEKNGGQSLEGINHEASQG